MRDRSWILILLASAGLVRGETRRPILEVVQVVEDVEVRLPGQDWSEPFAGQELPEGTLLSTGPDSELHVLFPDRSVLAVKAMTQALVSTLLAQGNAMVARIHLKVGEVAAQVNPDKVVTSDFSVATPVATASVRGTEINRVRFTPALGMQVDLQEGKLLVESSRGRVMITGTEDARAGDELVTPTGIVEETRLARLRPSGLTGSEEAQIRTTLRPAIEVPSLADSVRGSLEEASRPPPPPTPTPPDPGGGRVTPGD